MDTNKPCLTASLDMNVLSTQMCFYLGTLSEHFIQNKPKSPLGFPMALDPLSKKGYVVKTLNLNHV